MRRSLLLATGGLLGLVGLFVPSCTIATPFAGPGYARRTGVQLQTPRDTVVLALTSAVLDRAERAPFDRAIGEVADAMPAVDGLVGFSFRKQLFGRRAWTMSVWEDDAALDAFLRSDVHSSAMRAGGPATVEFRFYSAPIPASEVPLPWSRALALLSEHGSEY
ncbi:MAG: antibiotic biosynthesis monooxygenase [Planctomycetota bacterium]